MASTLVVNLPCSLATFSFDVFTDTTVADIKTGICRIRNATPRYELDHFELGIKGSHMIPEQKSVTGFDYLDVLLTRKGAAVQKIGRTPTADGLYNHLLYEDGMDIFNYIYGGLNVNTKLYRDNTSLSVAASRGNAAVVKALLQQFSEEIIVNTPENGSPLATASMSGFIDVVDLLLHCSDIDPNLSDFNGRNALLNACWSCQLPMISLLLSHEKTNPSHTDCCGWSPLYIGALLGSLDVIKRIAPKLTDEKDWCGGDRDGWTAFSVACSLGHLDIVKYLYSKCKSLLFIVTSEGFSPLYLATTNCKTKVVKYLSTLEGIAHSCLLKVSIPHLNTSRTPIQEAEFKREGQIINILSEIDISGVSTPTVVVISDVCDSLKSDPKDTLLLSSSNPAVDQETAADQELKDNGDNPTGVPTSSSVVKITLGILFELFNANWLLGVITDSYNKTESGTTLTAENIAILSITREVGVCIRFQVVGLVNSESVIISLLKNCEDASNKLSEDLCLREFLIEEQVEKETPLKEETLPGVMSASDENIDADLTQDERCVSKPPTDENTGADLNEDDERCVLKTSTSADENTVLSEENEPPTDENATPTNTDLNKKKICVSKPSPPAGRNAASTVSNNEPCEAESLPRSLSNHVAQLTSRAKNGSSVVKMTMGIPFEILSRKWLSEVMLESYNKTKGSTVLSAENVVVLSIAKGPTCVRFQVVGLEDSEAVINALVKTCKDTSCELSEKLCLREVVIENDTELVEREILSTFLSSPAQLVATQFISQESVGMSAQSKAGTSLTNTNTDTDKSNDCVVQ